MAARIALLLTDAQRRATFLVNTFTACTQQSGLYPNRKLIMHLCYSWSCALAKECLWSCRSYQGHFLSYGPLGSGLATPPDNDLNNTSAYSLLRLTFRAEVHSPTSPNDFQDIVALSGAHTLGRAHKSRLGLAVLDCAIAWPTSGLYNSLFLCFGLLSFQVWSVPQGWNQVH